MINASAGTGKTYTITEHYLDLLLLHEVEPQDILLVTFTDNAAKDLRHEVLQKLRHKMTDTTGDAQADRIRSLLKKIEHAPISTIHAFCSSFLRTHAIEAGLSPQFRVMEQEEQTLMLQEVAEQAFISSLAEDRDFVEFCSMKPIRLHYAFGASVTETAIRLIERAGSIGVDLSDALSFLDPPQRTIQLADFKSILESFDHIPSTPAREQAKLVLQELLSSSQTLSDFLTAQTAHPHSFKGGKGILTELRNTLKLAHNQAAYAEAYPTAEAFARFLARVASEYRAHKKQRDLLDFNDLQWFTLNAIQERSIPCKFRYMIIDEAQDTSRLQYHLLNSIWSQGGDLIVCGDRKQSIYGWRGADAHIMNDLEKALLQKNGEKQSLQVSWRSKKTLIDPINAIFSRLYPMYDEQDALQANPSFTPSSKDQSVECLLPNEATAYADRTEAVQAEMQALAKRIALLVHGANTWQPSQRYDEGFKPISDTNRYTYKDILILLRVTKHQPMLEQALRAHGIPYTISGRGQGLFSTSTAKDLSLLLRVLTDPSDLYALIGLLRSPWIGIDDQELTQKLAHETPPTSAGLLAQFPAWHERIEHSRNLLGRDLLSEQVRHWVETTHYDVLLLSQPQGEQHLANLKKLIDWLRIEERGASTLPGQVARTLAHYIEHPPPKSEATLTDPDRNAVTLMTIHGSKGLTHRVVCIPQLHFRPQPDRDFAILSTSEDQNPQLVLSLTKTESPAFTPLKAEMKARRELEQINLFYVAMTRARDLVILSSSETEKPKQWHEHILPIIDTDIHTRTFNEVASAKLDLSRTTESTPTVDHFLWAAHKASSLCYPPSITRTNVTTLTQTQQPHRSTSSTHTALSYTQDLGSLGHAVLEKAANEQWQLDIKETLIHFAPMYRINEKNALSLAPQLTAALCLAQEHTASADRLHTEVPFLLQVDHQLIDGTIDLIASYAKKLVIYDYKFTASDPNELTARYHQQLALYEKAARKLFPEIEEIEKQLLVIPRSTEPFLLSL